MKPYLIKGSYSSQNSPLKYAIYSKNHLNLLRNLSTFKFKQTNYLFHSKFDNNVNLKSFHSQAQTPCNCYSSSKSNEYSNFNFQTAYASVFGCATFAAFAWYQWKRNKQRDNLPVYCSAFAASRDDIAQQKHRQIVYDKNGDAIKRSASQQAAHNISTSPAASAFSPQVKQQPNLLIFSSDPSISSSTSSTENVTSFDSTPASLLPNHVPYLIVGGGLAGMTAARTIRAADPLSKVLIVSNDNYHHPSPQRQEEVVYPPYQRPPLSKLLWHRDSHRRAQLIDPRGDLKNNSWLFAEPTSFFLQPNQLTSAVYGGVALCGNANVRRLNAEEKWIEVELPSSFNKSEGGESEKEGDSSESSGRHRVHFDQVLLATGGQPRRAAQLERCAASGHNLLESRHVSYFRSLADFSFLSERLDQLIDKSLAEQQQQQQQIEGGRPRRIAVIGGGFLGTELAYTMAKRMTARMRQRKNLSSSSSSSSNSANSASATSKSCGLDCAAVEIVQILPESVTAQLDHVLPDYLAQHTRRYLTQHNVITWPDCRIAGLEARKRNQAEQQNEIEVVVKLDQTDKQKDKEERPEQTFDHVVVALGIEPNVQLAQDCETGEQQLEVDDNTRGSARRRLDQLFRRHNNNTEQEGKETAGSRGFLCNAQLQARQGVWVAGDAASYWDPLLGRRTVEHWNHAEESGELAGWNMVVSRVAETGEKTRQLEHRADIPAEVKQMVKNERIAVPLDQDPNSGGGALRTYSNQSSFWSSLGLELRWDAVGLIDARNLETHGFFFQEDDDDVLVDVMTANVEENSSKESTGDGDKEKGGDAEHSHILVAPSSLEKTPQNNEAGEGDSNKTNAKKEKEESFDSSGVVFYVHPRTRKLVGILLWNLPDEYFYDEKYAAPRRLNVARSVLEKRLRVSKDEEGEKMLQELALEFDLSEELDVEYQAMSKVLSSSSDSNVKDGDNIANDDDKKLEKVETK